MRLNISAHTASVTILLVTIAAAAAADTFDYRLTHAVRAHQVPELQTQTFLADGPLLFRGVYDAGPRLQIWDRTVPGAMVRLGDLALPRPAHALSRHGDLIYAADSDGIVIVDVSDPTAPAILADHPMTSVQFAAAQGDVLLVSRGWNGLSIHDTTDLSQLAVLAEMPLEGNAAQIALFEGRAVVGLGDPGFALIDIADPSAPVLLSQQSPNHSIRQLLAVNGLLLMVTSDVGFRFYDPMTGNYATFVAGFDDGLHYLSADATTDRLYLCAPENTIDVFDTSRLPELQRLTRHDYLPYPYHAALQDDLLLVDLYGRSFAWIDPEHATVAPDTLFTRDYGDSHWSLRARNGLVYGVYSQGSGPGGLRILDVRPGATGEELGLLEIDRTPARLAIQDDRAYLACRNTSALVVVDVADPTAPQHVSTTPLPFASGCTDVAVAGELAIAGYERQGTQGGVAFYDLGVPDQPLLQARLDLPERIYRVAFWNDLAIAVTDHDALYVLQLPRPYGQFGDILVVARLDLDFSLGVCGDLVVDDGIAWVLGWHDLFVVSLARPSDPVLLTTWKPVGTTGDTMRELVLRDDLAYISTSATGLTVLDVADPASPELLGYARPRGHAQSLAVDDRAAYVGQSEGGIVAWPLHRLVAPRRDRMFAPTAAASAAPAISVFPSPANPRSSVRFSLDRDQRATVTVHDLRGARVATLFDGRLTSGDHALIWDGRSRAGDPAASGTYLVRLDCADGVSTRKLVLVQ